MSDSYQLRKDIDKVLTDLYDYNEGLRVPLFRENSHLRYIGVNKDSEGHLTDRGTIDAILEYYGLLNIDEKLVDIAVGDFDLTGYVKTEDIVDNTKYDIDLNLSFGTKGFDDTITIDLDIVDYVVSKIINIDGDE